MKESAIASTWTESIALACITIVSLLLTLACLVAVRPAFAQSAPVGAGVRLEAGIEKEDVDGDLKSAMDIYQKIAADTSASRDVRAKALLRLAGCDEKLGHRAKQVYEQIVHDYADQPAAAQARSRLALLKQQDNPATPTTMNVRKIEWAGLGEMSPCDTDGHRAVYRAADGNLYFGDLAGQNKHLVFKVQPEDVPVWCVSRDLSMTTLLFAPKPNRPGTLAVIKTDGTGYRELVHDDAQGTMFSEGNNNFQFEWSWDTRHLLINFFYPPNGGSSLLMVDLADGHRRELVHLQSGVILWRAAFSPDGHFISYSTWQVAGSRNVMRIFVTHTEGSQSQQVYESFPSSNEDMIGHSRRLHDWTVDGRYLVISDVHFGQNALYLLPLKNGVVSGSPVFVREVETDDVHTTSSGALVFKEGPAPLNDWRVFHANLGPDGKVGAWQRLEIRGGNGGWSPSPSFSPDGAQIAYVSGDEEKGGRDLILRNLKTGQEQVLHWFSSGQPGCQYAYDLPKLFCTVGWDDNGGHSDLVSVAVASGAVEKLASFSDYRMRPIPSTDDQRIYLVAAKAFQEHMHFVRWDLSIQQDTVVDQWSRQILEQYVPTLDERWLIRSDKRGLATRPMSGGDWRFLDSPAPGALSDPGDTLPYGDWILFDAQDSKGKLRLYRIPISGGQPQLVGDLPINMRLQEGPCRCMRLSRDARQVLAQGKDESKANLWTLENFEPSDKK